MKIANTIYWLSRKAFDLGIPLEYYLQDRQTTTVNNDSPLFVLDDNSRRSGIGIKQKQLQGRQQNSIGSSCDTLDSISSCSTNSAIINPADCCTTATEQEAMDFSRPRTLSSTSSGRLHQQDANKVNSSPSWNHTDRHVAPKQQQRTSLDNVNSQTTRRDDQTSINNEDWQDVSQTH
jgi:hypothetical protein